ncbi:MAG: anaerobic ribonucleoside-triphosphate reductase activating protein [Clostridia bacterium]|nr:anaerobic ribonucleoside-triphosphate reductase activating protein [Clostridia bacterium]
MKLYGLQKMTLLDFPGRVACTVFLGGCDFRCPFCHNYELALLKSPPVMEEAEFLSFLVKRKGLLDGVAITGGEPCLWPDLPDFLRQIRGLGFAVKLDTNGAHPAVLREVLRGGLADYVAMDIKNSPEKYAETVGLPKADLAPVRESVQLLMREARDYEFRTTVVRELHEDEDFEKIGDWIQGARRYFLQPFADRDSVPFSGFHAPDKEALGRWLRIMRKYVPFAQIRGME